MKTKKIKGLLVFAVILTTLSAVPAMAEVKADFIIGNGTGDIITSLVISPSKAKYGKTKNHAAYQDVNVPDGGTFAVALSGEMSGIDCFDIELLSGGKRFKTRYYVPVNRNAGGIPVLELFRTGKSSTYGYIGGAAGGLVGTGAVIVATNVAAHIAATTAVHVAFSTGATIAGAGLFTGPGFFVAVPVAVATVGFIIGRSMTPGGLEAQVYYM
jgi:hypothetical protein